MPSIPTGRSDSSSCVYSVFTSPLREYPFPVHPMTISPSRSARRPASGWIGIALVAAASAILAHQLLLRPIVGLADNGDFDRITRPLGLAVVAPPAERYFR